jgi:hypothetical protein
MVIFVSYLESHPSLGPTLIRGYMFVSLVAEEAPSQNRIRVPGVVGLFGFPVQTILTSILLTLEVLVG